jgi:hypothetical protein
MVASEVHQPKLPMQIRRTVDGSVTDARSEQPSKAAFPIEVQPGPIANVVSALHA